MFVCWVKSAMVLSSNITKMWLLFIFIFRVKAYGIILTWKSSAIEKNLKFFQKMGFLFSHFPSPLTLIIKYSNNGIIKEMAFITFELAKIDKSLWGGRPCKKLQKCLLCAQIPKWYCTLKIWKKGFLKSYVLLLDKKWGSMLEFISN